MARTIAEIQQRIIDAKLSSPELEALDSTSNVAIWKLWTYIIAVAQWVLEQLMDKHVTEVATIISEGRAHTLLWYVTRAKQFQYGYTLEPESDRYVDVSTLPEVLIVKHAAAVELTNMIRIKVAGTTAGALAPLSSGELTALTAYMEHIKDAGVRLQVTSGPPDTLRLALNIYYDPLVLSSTGERLDTTSDTPVKDAVNAFLLSMPFNGLFVLNSLIKALEKVDGVVICQVVNASATYASLPYTDIPVEYTPDAGYMLLDDTYFMSRIGYIAHAPL